MTEQTSSKKQVIKVKPAKDEKDEKPPTQVIKVGTVSETEEARMNHDG